MLEIYLSKILTSKSPKSLPQQGVLKICHEVCPFNVSVRGLARKLANQCKGKKILKLVKESETVINKCVSFIARVLMHKVYLESIAELCVWVRFTRFSCICARAEGVIEIHPVHGALL